MKLPWVHHKDDHIQMCGKIQIERYFHEIFFCVWIIYVSVEEGKVGGVKGIVWGGGSTGGVS